MKTLRVIIIFTARLMQIFVKKGSSNLIEQKAKVSMLVDLKTALDCVNVEELLGIFRKNNVGSEIIDKENKNIL